MSRANIKPRRSVATPLPTSERILEGASRAFGKLGYAAVRVEDILLEAEVSRPTFYKLFGTKEETFQVLSSRHHQQIRDRIREAGELGGEPTVMMSRMLDAFLGWRAGLGPIGRVLDVEARIKGSVIADDRKKTLQDMTARINRLARLQGYASLDPVFIVAMIAALESVADSLLSGTRAEPQSLERAKGIALRLLYGALATAARQAPGG